MRAPDNRPEPDGNELRLDIDLSGDPPDGLSVTGEKLEEAARILWDCLGEANDGEPIMRLRMTLSIWGPE